MSPNEEFYPMPAFVMLEVGDTAATQKFWEQALGFRTVFAMPGPDGRPVLAHLRRARYADVLVRRAAAGGDGPKGQGVRLNYAVPLEEIDTLFQVAVGAGAQVVQAVSDRPWNARDFTVADPDGFHVTFTAGPLKAHRSFEEVMNAAKGAANPS